MAAPDRLSSAGRVPAVMLQGTGSDVGKSLLVAGLARAFTRQGRTVRPFKPQNMSNNAAVTADGGEIGRAQALQARACGVAPSVDMNPVLLKPQSEVGAQVVVQGRVEGNAAARDYHALKPKLLPRVLESFARLSQDADLVLIEGAGSPAEINLRDGDIANMGFAEAADVPVILVADIDRGGVIAALAGTVSVLEPAERARLKGFIVNKFRGDKRLFDKGVREIETRTGLKCLGVVPWFAEAVKLPAEDAAGLDSRTYSPVTAQRALRIAVPHLSHIANFDDFDPLAAEPDVVVTFVPSGRPLPLDADAIILPGSKATLADLAALRREGWDIDLAAYARSGGRILGLCGGYQMLGTRVSDPDGIEGPPGDAAGLGLLNVETVLEPAKILRASAGTARDTKLPVRGYEIHMGRTSGPDTARPLLDLGGRDDGAISADARIAGCYLHGLFTSDEFRAAWLASLRTGRDAGTVDYEKSVDDTLDRLADHLAQAIDLPRILEIAHAR